MFDLDLTGKQRTSRYHECAKRELPTQAMPPRHSPLLPSESTGSLSALQTLQSRYPLDHNRESGEI